MLAEFFTPPGITALAALITAGAALLKTLELGRKQERLFKLRVGIEESRKDLIELQSARSNLLALKRVQLDLDNVHNSVLQFKERFDAAREIYQAITVWLSASEKKKVDAKLEQLKKVYDEFKLLLLPIELSLKIDPTITERSMKIIEDFLQQTTEAEALIKEVIENRIATLKRTLSE